MNKKRENVFQFTQCTRLFLFFFFRLDTMYLAIRPRLTILKWLYIMYLYQTLSLAYERATLFVDIFQIETDKRAKFMAEPTCGSMCMHTPNGSNTNRMNMSKHKHERIIFW